MENEQDLSQKGVLINLPVKVKYSAFEGYLKDNFVGENIQKEKKNDEVINYAEILGVALSKSPEEGYDLVLDLDFKMLTKLFRNRNGSIRVHVAVDFDENEQQLGVKHFKVKSDSSSWFMNNSIEAIANTFIHGKLKKKMKLDVRGEVEKQLNQVNQKLNDEVEIFEGIFLTGFMDKLRIKSVYPEATHFMVLVNMEGYAVVDIEKMKFSN